MTGSVTDSQTAELPTAMARATRRARAAVAPLALVAIAALAGGHAVAHAGPAEADPSPVVAMEAETEILTALVVERTP